MDYSYQYSTGAVFSVYFKNVYTCCSYKLEIKILQQVIWTFLSLLDKLYNSYVGCKLSVYFSIHPKVEVNFKMYFT